MFDAHRFGLTVACAGTGYGKSILAAQLASSGFDGVLWITVLEGDTSGERLMSLAATSLARVAQPAAEPSAQLPLLLTRDEALVAIQQSLLRLGSTRICVVLDGVRSLQNLVPLQELAALLRSGTAGDSAVIVTCRRVLADAAFNGGSDFLVLDENDLRFGADDLLPLARLNGWLESQDECQKILNRFEGHPALTSLMLQHAGLDDGTNPPQGLVWYVDRLTEDLPLPALRLLYAASLLTPSRVHTIMSCCETTLSASAWEQVKALSPLFVIDRRARSSSDFAVHAVLAEAAQREAQRRLNDEDAARLRQRALEHLAETSAYPRMAAMLELNCSESEVANWLERCGTEMLRFVGSEIVLNCLRALPPSRLAANPALLLLLARALREQECFEEARETALVAWQLAEAIAEQEITVAAALLVARLDLDLVDLDAAQQALEQVKTMVSGTSEASDLRLAEAYMAVVEAQQGRLQEAMSRVDRLVRSAAYTSDLGSDDAVFTIGCIASVQGLCGGHWESVARLAAGLSRRQDLSPLQRLQLRANMASCYLELGRLSEADSLIEEVLAQVGPARQSRLCGYAYGTRSCIRHARGEHALANEDYLLSEKLHDIAGDQMARTLERINGAMNMRAVSRPQEALRLAEAAQLISEEPTFSFALWQQAVRIEISASLVALGDIWGGENGALQARRALQATAADGQLLRADLVLAEIDRLKGSASAGVDRLAQHAEYIATGSANWLTAMYVRAFPGLLGMLARALGAEALPLRMLLMLLPETVDRALSAADYLEERERTTLLQRCGSHTESAGPRGNGRTGDNAACHVRVFGGLEVTTPNGMVEEEDWRKRKARLLFLTLVLRQRQDIPRDVLLERLWPDMDEEHARRNFYVTWSTMKRALSCTDIPADAKAFVQCSGGVCRITRLVRSDLDDFDEALASLRSAASSGDVAGIQHSASTLMRIYRGELLPGDLYEEWFSETRDRTKHDFCDAMVTASTVLAAAGLGDDALVLLRKASAVDPWREDVYQAMMRCQIGSGQRSRAIETYLACRSRLTEDLGIDPSVETTKLYQAVLAMDAPPNDMDL